MTQAKRRCADEVRRVAAELGDDVCGLLVMHRGRKFWLEPKGGSWMARTDLEDNGDDVLHVVEEWADTATGALDAAADAADAAEPTDVDDDPDGAKEDAWFEQRNTPR